MLKAAVRTTALSHLEPPTRRPGPTPFYIGSGQADSTCQGEGAAPIGIKQVFLVCANGFACNLNEPYTPIHTMIGGFVSITWVLFLPLLGPSPRALEASARRSTVEEASLCSIPQRDIWSEFQPLFSRGSEPHALP
jgi:hypothetical protein